MSVTASLLSVSHEGRYWVRRFRLAFTGSYAQSGTTGDIIDLTAVLNPKFLERAKPSKCPGPADVQILNEIPGYVGQLYVDESSPALSACLGVRLFQSDDAVDELDELANGAYTADVTDFATPGMIIELREKN